MSRRCEECGAVLDPTKLLRCTKCKACFYCSRECQARNWKRIHKKVCTTDPSLWRFVPVEMAVERALARHPKIKAPKEAFCYICLQGEDDETSSSSSKGKRKLMRGCACRGTSAGFVHLECLVELAERKDETEGKDETEEKTRAVFAAWTSCVNCRQDFTGPVELQMLRYFWRRYRSSPNIELCFNSLRALAYMLERNNELDAANRLYDGVSKFAGIDNVVLRSIKLNRADIMKRNGQELEALELLKTLLDEAKEDMVNPLFCLKTMIDMAGLLGKLGRHQECLDTSTEAIAFANANFPPDDINKTTAMQMAGIACAGLGRVDKCKAILTDVLAARTRILGRDHHLTKSTREFMVSHGFAIPVGYEEHP